MINYRQEKGKILDEKFREDPAYMLACKYALLLTHQNPFTNRYERARFSRMAVQAALEGSEMQDLIADVIGQDREHFKHKIFLYNLKVLNNMGEAYKPVIKENSNAGRG